MVLAVWDELRGDYRHFRLDRIATPEVLEVCVPHSRRRLIAAWEARMEEGW